jgi:hypothetical protein
MEVRQLFTAKKYDDPVVIIWMSISHREDPESRRYFIVPLVQIGDAKP